MTKTDILIIGGGPAGILAGLVGKKLMPKKKIFLIKDEKGVIVRCSEPYVVGNEVCLNQIIHPDEKMLRENGIDFLVDRVIDFWDFPKNRIALTQQGKKIKFKELILATGAKPFIPSIPGIKDQKNIFVLRNANDVRKINQAIKRSLRAVIIGGGAIGVEVAALLKQRGLKVTILEIANQLMPGACDTEKAAKVKNVLEKQKINVKLGVTVKEIKKEAIITSQEKIKYDLIICACGVRASTELAEKLGCRLGKFGIKVNQFGQTSVKGIWAAGDCAQVKSLITQKVIPSQLATTAVMTGKIVGMNLAGKKIKFTGVLNPVVSCFFNFGIGRVGLAEKQAIENGLKIITTEAQSMDQYPSQPNTQPIEVKLIFNLKNRQLIGAQLFGGKKSLGMRVNLLSLAIAHRLTADDLSKLNYCAHPELTPLPFMEPIVMAAEEAKERMEKQKF